MNKSRIILFTCGVIVVSMAGYIYKLQRQTEKLNELVIKCKEEQITLHENLKKSEEMKAMLEYRSKHLEASLKNQDATIEELLKRCR